jgi:hypothetical protein
VGLQWSPRSAHSLCSPSVTYSLGYFWPMHWPIIGHLMAYSLASPLVYSLPMPCPGPRAAALARLFHFLDSNPEPSSTHVIPPGAHYTAPSALTSLIRCASLFPSYISLSRAAHTFMHSNCFHMLCLFPALYLTGHLFSTAITVYVVQYCGPLSFRGTAVGSTSHHGPAAPKKQRKGRSRDQAQIKRRSERGTARNMAVILTTMCVEVLMGVG